MNHTNRKRCPGSKEAGPDLSLIDDNEVEALIAKYLRDGEPAQDPRTSFPDSGSSKGP